ncbi:MAG: hypothetical protein HYV28_18545 [Ignavibacteriales bacterium]|nr:hypothetical protein [Ignavibacteriales bacterium]
MNTNNKKWYSSLKSASLALILLLGVVVTTNGCKDDTATAAKEDNFQVSQMKAASFTEFVGNLVLDTVKILLKDIKLNVISTSDSTNFKTGPYVLFLNMNSSVNSIGRGYIPIGSYDKIMFEIHKLSSTELIPDPEFAQGSLRFSIVAKGTYNGVRFVYKSDKSAKQKLSFPNSLVVTETMSNVTLQINPNQWFADTNNNYLDPNLESNRNLIDNNIKDNIKANFKAFRDNNKDGIPE